MNEGFWVVIGALIGAAGPIITTWIKLRGSADYFDKLAVKLFRKILTNQTLKSDDLIKFGKRIGLDEKETGQILVMSGAEPVANDEWRLAK